MAQVDFSLVPFNGEYFPLYGGFYRKWTIKEQSAGPIQERFNVLLLVGAIISFFFLFTVSLQQYFS